MKKLMPSLREGRRYLAFESLSPVPVGEEGFRRVLLQESRDLYGDRGTADLDLWLVEFRENMGLLRCRPDGVSRARALLGVVHRVGETPLAIRVVGVSGTIRGARRHLSPAREVLPPLDPSFQ